MKTLVKLLAGLLIALNASYVFAQTVENDLVGLGMAPELAEYISGILPGGSVLDNDTFLKGRNAADSADISILKVDGSDETVLNADTGDAIVLSVATTPVAQLNASGFYVAPFAADATFVADTAPRLAAYVPTMAATPAAGTNDFKIGYNVVPTAAADTAALLPTPGVAGKYVQIFNSGPNAVRIKAGGTNTINASAAGAYIPLATFRMAECRSASAGAWVCTHGTVPTPAGP